MDLKCDITHFINLMLEIGCGTVAPVPILVLAITRPIDKAGQRNIDLAFIDTKRIRSLKFTGLMYNLFGVLRVFLPGIINITPFFIYLK